MTRDPLGCGWPFPPRPDPRTGALPMVSGEEKVRQAIRLILETEPGERVMLPAFGCGLRRYLMKPNTAAVRALIQRDVEAALRAWEPRIRLQSVRVEEADDPSAVWIEIAYAYVRNGKVEQMTYPFSLE